MVQAKQSIDGQFQTPQQQADQAEQQYLALLGHSAFPDKEAMIIIRPLDENLSGAKLEALLNAVRMRYKSFKIVMADTLAGHILGSRGKGKDAAAEWLVKNAQYMTDKEINGIISWDIIAGGKAFERKHETLKLLYHTHEDARYYVNMTCADRMRRLVAQKQRSGEAFDQKDLMQGILSYRLEELAGLAMLREKKDIPELSTEDYVSDDRLYDRMTKETLVMPRIYPVTFKAVEQREEFSLAQD